MTPTAPTSRRVLFLPGAVGAADFWRPVSDLLPRSWDKVRLNWPGAGDEPHDPAVRGLADLVDRTAEAAGRGRGPYDVVAQSMGGIVAMRLAVEHAVSVRRLVLVATSGGVDTAAAAGVDWRAEYRTAYPQAAAWVTDSRPDHTEAIRSIAAPTLLIWGDADPISPVAVGERLAALLPAATLIVIPGGTHDLGRDHAAAVARLIADHLGTR
jgi:pimeloyl-ACP methyl ester carboxylesterase